MLQDGLARPTKGSADYGKRRGVYGARRTFNRKDTKQQGVWFGMGVITRSEPIGLRQMTGSAGGVYGALRTVNRQIQKTRGCSGSGDTKVRADGRGADFEKGCFYVHVSGSVSDQFLDLFLNHFGTPKMIPKWVQDLNLSFKRGISRVPPSWQAPAVVQKWVQN